MAFMETFSFPINMKAPFVILYADSGSRSRCRFHRKFSAVSGSCRGRMVLYRNTVAENHLFIGGFVNCKFIQPPRLHELTYCILYNSNVYRPVTIQPIPDKNMPLSTKLTQITASIRPQPTEQTRAHSSNADSTSKPPHHLQIPERN